MQRVGETLRRRSRNGSPAARAATNTTAWGVLGGALQLIAASPHIDARTVLAALATAALGYSCANRHDVCPYLPDARYCPGPPDVSGR